METMKTKHIQGADPFSVLPACYVLIFCVTAFSGSTGLTYPLLALIMERSGENASAIALNAAMTPLGIVAATPLINHYANRYSTRALIVTGIGLSILLLFLIGLFRDPLAWLLFRFLLGSSITVVYVLSEATLLAIAPDSHRGRLMGAYTSITNVGYAIGPLLLALVGSTSMTPFLLISTILIVAMAPFFFIPVDCESAEAQKEVRISLLVFLRSGGFLVAAYAATTLFDNSFMSLLPAFGPKTGLNEAGISVILFCLLFGGAVVQMPLGWIIDRSSVFTALIACSLIGISGFPLFAALIPAMIPAIVLAFLWGGAVLGVQTIALTEMGKRYSGAMLLAGNSTLALMWGVSGIVGIPIAGYAMDWFGPYGLLTVVGGVFTITTLAFAGNVLFHNRRAIDPAREDHPQH